MTSQSRIDLQSDIDAKIASGVAASVSAQDVREVATDLSDSSFNLTTNDTDDITEGDNKFATAAQLTKLDGVEDNATADQTNAEIETAYNAQVAVVTQAEAEAGTSTDVKRFTPERIKQAIDALSSGGGGSSLYYRGFNESVSNTTAATDLVGFDILGGDLGTNKILCVDVVGYIRNTSGVSANFVLSVNLGSTTIFSAAAKSMVSDISDDYQFTLSLMLANADSASVQVLGGNMIINLGLDDGTGRGQIGTDEISVNGLIGDKGGVTEDTSTDKAFSIKVQPSVANANFIVNASIIKAEIK